MQIRKARLTDVQAIQALVNQFAREELMLPLSIGDIYERLRDFLLIEMDGTVVACGAIHVTWETLVELRSLAVSREHDVLFAPLNQFGAVANAMSAGGAGRTEAVINPFNLKWRRQTSCGSAAHRARHHIRPDPF